MFIGELNYGWDIDHIIPFAKNEEDILKEIIISLIEMQ
jgi:hypothetical protein